MRIQQLPHCEKYFVVATNSEEEAVCRQLAQSLKEGDGFILDSAPEFDTATMLAFDLPSGTSNDQKPVIVLTATDDDTKAILSHIRSSLTSDVGGGQIFSFCQFVENITEVGLVFELKDDPQ